MKKPAAEHPAGAAEAAAEHPAGATKAARGAVVVLCLVQFVDVLGVTELIAAMPRMLTAVSASPTAASPILTAYAMCFGGLLMLGARLGDRVGHRAALLAGLVAFAAGSVVAAAA